MQNWGNSIADALELPQSCTKPLIACNASVRPIYIDHVPAMFWQLVD